MGEKEFCPECKLTIGQDSRVFFGRIPFHSVCLMKIQNHAREFQTEIQVWFRGNDSEVRYERTKF